MAEYIEREKAYDAVMLAVCEKVGQLKATIAIDLIPAADVAPVVHGRWECGCQCSVCGDRHGPYNSRHKPYYNFCPNCGAKMDEEVDGRRKYEKEYKKS